MTVERKQLPTEGNGTIVYYSQKDKKHISRRGVHDEKSRIDTNKKGEEYYVYYAVSYTHLTLPTKRIV